MYLKKYYFTSNISPKKYFVLSKITICNFITYRNVYINKSAKETIAI